MKCVNGNIVITEAKMISPATNRVEFTDETNMVFCLSPQLVIRLYEFLRHEVERKMDWKTYEKRLFKDEGQR